MFLEAGCLLMLQWPGQLTTNSVRIEWSQKKKISGMLLQRKILAGPALSKRLQTVDLLLVVIGAFAGLATTFAATPLQWQRK